MYPIPSCGLRLKYKRLHSRQHMRDLETNALPALLRWSSGQQFRSVCGMDVSVTRKGVASMVSHAEFDWQIGPVFGHRAPFGPRHRAILVWLIDDQYRFAIYR